MAESRPRIPARPRRRHNPSFLWRKDATESCASESVHSVTENGDMGRHVAGLPHSVAGAAVAEAMESAIFQCSAICLMVRVWYGVEWLLFTMHGGAISGCGITKACLDGFRTTECGRDLRCHGFPYLVPGPLRWSWPNSYRAMGHRGADDGEGRARPTCL